MSSLSLFCFEKIKLGKDDYIEYGQMPTELSGDNAFFKQLWRLHPDAYEEVILYKQAVLTPRWQQAYEKDYYFSGQNSVAKPLPDILLPYLGWAKQEILWQLNGVLVNWYDGSLGHYIGRHRDSRTNLVNDSVIVTLSFGEERVMRFRPWSKALRQECQLLYFDLKLLNGDVVIIPWKTNLAWTHEIPKFKRYNNKRISVTLRAFLD